VKPSRKQAQTGVSGDDKDTLPRYMDLTIAVSSVN